MRAAIHTVSRLTVCIAIATAAVCSTLKTFSSIIVAGCRTKDAAATIRRSSRAGRTTSSAARPGTPTSGVSLVLGLICIPRGLCAVLLCCVIACACRAATAPATCAPGLACRAVVSLLCYHRSYTKKLPPGAETAAAVAAAEARPTSPPPTRAAKAGTPREAEPVALEMAAAAALSSPEAVAQSTRSLRDKCALKERAAPCQKYYTIRAGRMHTMPGVSLSLNAVLWCRWRDVERAPLSGSAAVRQRRSSIEELAGGGGVRTIREGYTIRVGYTKPGI
jgi:hypothetical protein